MRKNKEGEQYSEEEDRELKRVTTALTLEMYTSLASLGFAGANLVGRGMCAVKIDSKWHELVGHFKTTGELLPEKELEVSYLYVTQRHLEDFFVAAMGGKGESCDELIAKFSSAIDTYNPNAQVVICYDLDGWEAITGIIVGDGTNMGGETLSAPADIFIERAVRRLLESVARKSIVGEDENGEPSIALQSGAVIELSEELVGYVASDHTEEFTPSEDTLVKDFGDILSELIDRLGALSYGEQEEDTDEDDPESDLGPPPDYVLDAFE